MFVHQLVPQSPLLIVVNQHPLEVAEPYCVEDPWFSVIDRDKLPPRVRIDSLADKPALLRGIQAEQNLVDWDEQRWLESIPGTIKFQAKSHE